MTQKNLQVDDRNAAGAESAATEHLVRLPKMSATAGVGVQEYVAISVSAVFSLLLGFASLLAIMESALIVIPILALALSIVALRQINRSNGTQTGRGVARAGMFLAIAIGSFVMSGSTIEEIERRGDSQAIEKLCEKFGDDVSQRDFDGAYALFSERFHSRTGRDVFIKTLKGLQDELALAAKRKQGYGEIKSASDNGLVHFFVDTDSGAVTAQSMMLLNFTISPVPDSRVIAFRKSGSDWFIDDIIQMFPTPQKR